MQSEERVNSIFSKYDIKRIQWYVDYPEKPHWRPPYGVPEYECGLKDIYSQSAALLYVHMPYCHTQCYFCNCKTIISLDYKNVKNYMEDLYREMDLQMDFCARNGLKPKFTEIHLGGGSPTYLTEEDFWKLVEYLQKMADFTRIKEFSIEIDPRRIDADRMFFYRDMGINRISFGIQDIELEVQKAINRVQPPFLIGRLLVPEIRKLFSHGVNFDIMGGLPNQTRKSFRRTMEQVIEFSPDRLSLLLMSIVPKFSKHQLLMPLDKVPSTYDTKLMFMDAIEILTGNGYVRTGYDHFAKPTDEVTEARNSGDMKWGYYGCTAGRYEDVLGLGISSYSKLGQRHYSQNFYELDNWKKALAAGKFPLYRGHILDDDDVIRRDVIQVLRNYFSVSFEDVGKVHDIDFPTYFRRDLKRLEELASDGLVEVSNDGVRLTEIGTLFADFVSGQFDAYLYP